MLSRRLSRRPLQALEKLRLRQTILHQSPLEFRYFGSGIVKPNFGDNTPREELHRWYSRNDEENHISESSFQFEDRSHKGKTWWTARFVCPETDDVYEAGTLAADKRQYEKWQWSKRGGKIPIQFGNKLYYSRLKTAIHAAAARRLDVIKFENTGSSYRKYCEEDPSLLARKMKTRRVDEIAIQLPKEDLKKVDAESPAFTSLKLFHAATRNSPKDSLHNYYGKLNLKIHEEVESILHTEPVKDGDDSRWWAMTFTCPESKRKYTSGSIRSGLLSFDIGDIRYIDDQPYYRDKKTATHAATARVLDHLEFASYGTKEPRLCEEDPSSHDAVCEHPQNQQLTKQSKIKATSVGVMSLENVEIDGEENLNEGLTLQSLPAPSFSLTTLDRLMEAWSESIATTEKTTISPTVAVLPLTWTPSQERGKMLSEAKAWLDSLQSQPKESDFFVRFNHPLQVSTLASSNSILSVLAKANQISNGSDVQAIADLVFNFLWSGPKPNAETYNNYIQCLSGEPRKVAQMAQEILEEMLSGKEVAGNRIPSPTVQVFNTVITLWAWAEDGEKCQAVFDLMRLSNVEANRETCMNMLASLAHGNFDYDKASVGIASMKEAGLWDMEAYYAPIRWGGKQMEAKVFPWDDLDKIYSSGFDLSSTHHLNSEAEAVDKWVTSIEQAEDLKITIGCYEAAIQAWVRTGTRKGLERAESWALRSFKAAASDGTLHPRLQTFSPILAAWAFSGEGQAIVPELIGRLQEWSNTYPQLQPEGRINSIRLLARNRYLESLLTKDKHTDADMETAQLITAESRNELTLQCTQLIEYHSGQERLPFFLETSAFLDVLVCLRSYGQGAARRKDDTEAKAATVSILEVVSHFQATLKRLHSFLQDNDQNTGKDTLEDGAASPALHFQLNHFLNNATSVYTCALCCVNEIESASTERDSTTGSQSLQATSLPQIEIMLRSSEECRRLITAQGDTSAPVEVLYSDNFSYSQKYTTSSQIELCSQIVKCITQLENPGSSDQVRILALIADILFEDTQSPFDQIQLSSLCLDIVGFIQSNAPSDEKEAVLQHFLKIMSGKAKNSIGVVDVNALAKAAKVRFHHNLGDDNARNEAGPKQMRRSSSGSPNRQKRYGKRKQRRNSK